MTGPARIARALLCAAAGMAAVPDASAQRLGRLFTTPEQRATLDEIRYQAQFSKPAPAPEPDPVVRAAPEPAPEGPVISRLTVNGVVRRSAGRGTVWVNGDEVPRGTTTREGIVVQEAGRSGRSVRVRLPSGIDTIELKPGQEIDVQSGTVLEPYERRRGESTGPSAFQVPAAPARPTPAPSAPGSGAAASAGAAAPAQDAASVPAAAPDRAALAERLRAIAALPAAEQARALEQLQDDLGARGGAQGAPAPR